MSPTVPELLQPQGCTDRDGSSVLALPVFPPLGTQPREVWRGTWPHPAVAPSQLICSVERVVGRKSLSQALGAQEAWEEVCLVLAPACPAEVVVRKGLVVFQSPGMPARPHHSSNRGDPEISMRTSPHQSAGGRHTTGMKVEVPQLTRGTPLEAELSGQPAGCMPEGAQQSPAGIWNCWPAHS